MHKESSGLMRSAATLLRILIVGNLLCLLLFLAILVLSFAGQALVLDALRKGQPGIDADASLVAVRLVMLIGMAVVGLAHAVLSRLRQIVETVRAGDPFVPGNAARLTAIAWALLGMQV